MWEKNRVRGLKLNEEKKRTTKKTLIALILVEGAAVWKICTVIFELP